MPTWSTLIYPIVFLIRRIVFVAITFLLFDHPGIQIQVFIFSSIVYQIFIHSYVRFKPKTFLWSELANEAVFLLVCYHMVLFSNLIWEPHIKVIVGYSMIVFSLSLLSGNSFCIVYVTLKG